MFGSDSSPVRFETGRGHRRPVLQLFAALLVMLALSGASSLPALAGRADSEPYEARASFELELPNGNTLSFIPTYDPAGRLLGYGIAESMLPETAGYLDIRELRSADPAEIFHALTPRGAEIPSELVRAYGQPEPRTQGWALNHDIWKLYINPCYKSNFEASFPSFAPNHVISYNDGVPTNPGAWDWTPHDGLRTVRHTSSVPSYYAKVTRCKAADTQYPGGPDVRLDGLQSGIPFYVYLGSLPSWGSTVDFAWYSANGLPPTSWKLNVTWSWPGDEFHIGYAYAAYGISP